jgi:hypothetical protein
MGSMHPQEGLNPDICSLMAKVGLGSFSYDAFGTACWSVYGMPIQLNPVMNSMMEGTMITNINFNAWTAPAVAIANPGSNGFSSGNFNSA